MGKFKSLVDSSADMEGFTAKYHIPQGVGLEYCSSNQILTKRETGQVVIPMIAFIEGGMTIPMGRITRDYLHDHRLAPHQCIANMFQILGCVDAWNEQMNLGHSWHDVVHLYECYCLSESYYQKSRSEEVRLISCLPKSNKDLKGDYLIVSRAWHDDLYCLVRVGAPGRTL